MNLAEELIDKLDGYIEARKDQSNVKILDNWSVRFYVSGDHIKLTLNNQAFIINDCNRKRVEKFRIIFKLKTNGELCFEKLRTTGCHYPKAREDFIYYLTDYFPFLEDLK